MNAPYVQYNINAQVFNAGNWIDSNCAEISFINQGTSTCIINGITLPAGIGMSISGNYGEVDKTKYYMNFTGSGVNNLLVVRKNYTD